METPLIYIECDMGELTAPEYRRLHCPKRRHGLARLRRTSARAN